jgi:hypothetical protein
MNLRTVRLIMAVVFILLFYVVLLSDVALSMIYPQIQVALVGLIKASLGATVGFVVGLYLYPHKINWGLSYGIVGVGAIARLLTILMFTYIGVTYA